MADIDNSSFIGNHSVAPSAAQVETMRRYDSALGNVGTAKAAEAAGAIIIALGIFIPVPASTTKSSVRYKAPFPLDILAVEVGCEAAGGATGTVDVFTDDTVTDASILSAAQDVKTAAGTSTRRKPTTTSVYQLDEGDEVYIKGASGAGGTLDGAQALLYCKRR
jgi:hypothetical protein